MILVFLLCLAAVFIILSTIVGYRSWNPALPLYQFYCFVVWTHAYVLITILVRWWYTWV